MLAVFARNWARYSLDDGPFASALACGADSVRRLLHRLADGSDILPNPPYRVAPRERQCSHERRGDDHP